MGTEGFRIVSMMERVGLRRWSAERVYYGWYIVGAAMASNFLLLGIIIFSFGAFIKPMQEEMGWSVTAISIGFSIRSFQQGTMSPFTGYLIDRFGPRKMSVLGITIAALGLVLFSQSRELWVYYTSAVVISIGGSLGTFAPFSRAIATWFNKKRGRAVGLANSGNAMAYFVLAGVTAMVAAIGWRETLLVAAAVTFFVGIPLALVIRENPGAYGYLPDGERMKPQPEPGPGEEEAPRAAPPEPGGFTVAQALRTPAFYLVSVPVGIGAAAFATWITHLVVHLEDVGFSPGFIAVMVGVYGVVQAGLRITTGVLGDALGRRRMFLAGCLLWATGFFLLAHLTPSRLWILPLFYLTASIGHAGWSVLGTTAMADYFGPRRYSTLYGLSTLIQLPLGITLPTLAGWLFDRNGDYVVAFYVLAGVVASGAVFLALIRRPMWGAVPKPARAPVGT